MARTLKWSNYIEASLKRMHCVIWFYSCSGAWNSGILDIFLMLFFSHFTVIVYPDGLNKKESPPHHSSCRQLLSIPFCEKNFPFLSNKTKVFLKTVIIYIKNMLVGVYNVNSFYQKIIFKMNKSIQAKFNIHKANFHLKKPFKSH